MKSPRKLGIVGCGAIGSLVALLLEKKRYPYRITALLDVNPQAARKLSRSLKSRPKTCSNLQQLLGKCDLVLEAASVKAALPVAEAALKAHKPLVMMSTGAYLLNRKKLEALARRTGTKLYLPSGAVCGMDGIRAARQLGVVTEARITSTKPPKGFQGAPGIGPAMAKKLSRARKPLVLYNGGVLGAIRSFPANVNVAATTALALGRPEKLRVQVIADPDARLNQHEIVLSGTFGRLRTLTQNVPSKLNPKTSALAIQAALALLERLASPVEVGA